MMCYMKFMVAGYEYFCPFFMKQVMDITKGCPSPEESGKKGKIIIQSKCKADKHATENE